MFTKNPVVEEFDYKYVRFFFPFKIYSKILGGWIFIPQKFICDRESVPIIKGTSIRGGYGHDLVCRIDAADYIEMDSGKEKPILTKKLAADIYLDIMKGRDEIFYSKEIRRLKLLTLIIKKPTWKQKVSIWKRKAAIETERLSRFNRRWVKYSVVRVWCGYFQKLPVLATLKEIKGEI